MNFTMFRHVAPIKKMTPEGCKLVFVPHPTDLTCFVTGISDGFEFDKSSRELVQMKDNSLVEMTVFYKGIDRYVLENNFYGGGVV